jgi:hypothetical protein
MCWKPCSSCSSLHLLREEFLSAPIHSPPLSGSPYRSFIKSTNTCGQSWSKTRQTLLKPLCPSTPSGTFAAFSKFHLNTSKSPNIKVVQFFEGHNFHVGWHFKFWVEIGEKLGQLQSLLFISALQNHNFAWRSCSNQWEKHRTAFVKVVEGTSHYNFRFWRKFHPVQIFGV